MALAGTELPHRRHHCLCLHTMETLSLIWKRQMRSPASSPADRGKRSANSAAHSVKRQHRAELCSPMAAEIQTPSLAAYATTDNPASVHTLKAMLLSLQADMQNKFRSSINHLLDRVDDLEDRTDHIEQHLRAATIAHNTIVNIQDEHSEAIHQLCL